MMGSVMRAFGLGHACLPNLALRTQRSEKRKMSVARAEARIYDFCVEKARRELLAAERKQNG